MRTDAAILHGIVNLLEDGPASLFEIEMILHLGRKPAKRLCRKLEQAGIIRHPPIQGVSPRHALKLNWELSDAFLYGGEIEFDANDSVWRS
jgi:DNA-binding Lrp family transcriptional regulator